MEAEWVIGVFTGEQAKRVKGMVDTGLGYFIRKEAGKGTSYTVEAAFRRAIDSPTPEHLLLATSIQAEKLEDKRTKRMNLRNEARNAQSS